MPTAPSHVDVDTAAALRAAIGKLTRRLRPTAAAAAAGLSPATVSVLLTIARLGPIRLSDLAVEEDLNPTMLSRVVAGLSAGGYVTRVSDPGDGRAALVEATPSGRKLRDRMRRERTDALIVALETLPEADLQAVERALPVLERLAESLKERRP